MACRPLAVSCIELEVTTRCNWSCEFCPVSIDPKKPAVMSMELFEYILQKAKAHGVQYISPNAYNEPTIDPLFLDRAEMLVKYGLKMILHSNGSGLTDAKIARLKELNVLESLTFNLPTLDPEKFKAMTGYDKLEKTLEVHRKCIDAGFAVQFSVNGTNEELRANLPAIKVAYPGRTPFPRYNLELPVTGTDDRAGKLENKHGKWFGITLDRLAGCRIPHHWLSMNIHGDFFLCCMDYDQKTTYGNIKDGTIAEILTSPKAKAIYDQMDGDAIADKDFLCRKCHVMAQTIHDKTLIARPGRFITFGDGEVKKS